MSKPRKDLRSNGCSIVRAPTRLPAMVPLADPTLWRSFIKNHKQSTYVVDRDNCHARFSTNCDDVLSRRTMLQNARPLYGCAGCGSRASAGKHVCNVAKNGPQPHEA